MGAARYSRRSNLSIDDSLYMEGGGSVGVNSGATLTLGLTSASGASEIDAGSLEVAVALVAHGGLSLDGGTLYAGGTVSAGGTITLDSGTSLTLSAGAIDLTTGSLALTGNLQTTGGQIKAKYDNSGSYGQLNVTGNVDLGTGACSLTVTASEEGTFNVLTWTGTETGDFSAYDLPDGWAHTWNSTSLEVYYD